MDVIVETVLPHNKYLKEPIVAAERSKTANFQIQVGSVSLRPRFESHSGFNIINNLLLFKNQGTGLTLTVLRFFYTQFIISRVRRFGSKLGKLI